MEAAATSPLLDAASPPLPTPRGELSAAISSALLEAPSEISLPSPASVPDTFADEDHQLALYMLYELHYRGFEGVSTGWEWNLSLLRTRAELESACFAELEALSPRPSGTRPEEVGGLLFEIAADDDGPAVSRYLETQGAAEQLRELMIHRSAYQLKEADPHTWGIPRLSGDPKAAFIEIQADEYGGGRPERMHSRLFAEAMEAVGLDGTYAAYIDRIPAISLATLNLISMLGLHRCHRGALVGHLAMVEITSAIPARRYGNAMRRLGLATPAAVDFYDEHVEADSVHENIAAYDMAQRLAVTEPELADDIIFGARALLVLDARLGWRMMDAWAAGESSLLPH